MNQIYNRDSTNRFDSVDQAGPEKAAQFANYLEGLSTNNFVVDYIRASLRALNLREGLSHLEVGCGIAHDLSMLADLVGESGKITLLDNSETMLKRAHEQVARTPGTQCPVEFQLGDAHKIPFDEQFDTARIVRVLQHLDDPRLAVTEMARVLKPGGAMCLIEPHWSMTQIEAADRQVTDAFLSDLHKSIKNPGIGGELGDLCRDTGLLVREDMVLELKYSNLQEAAKAISFEDRLTKLVDKEIISRDQADAWLDDLKQRSTAETFSMIIPFGFVVAEKS